MSARDVVWKVGPVVLLFRYLVKELGVVKGYVRESERLEIESKAVRIPQHDGELDRLILDHHHRSLSNYQNK